ncbi:MAG TPA: DUF2927 domain-containing protein [bacterium]|nr:DUF2927 domain-containing protein [bacterium]
MVRPAKPSAAPRWKLACGAFAVLAGCTARPPVPASNLEVRWVTGVLLGAEVGDHRNRVIRWREPVRYLIVDGDRRFRAAVDGAFEQLRASLQGVHELRLEHVASGDVRIGRPGYVTVFAVAPTEAFELALRLGAHLPSTGVDGWFTTFWDQRYVLRRGLVFVDPLLGEPWLAHTVLEEMFHCLGPSNDSSLLSHSLIYEGATDFGSRTSLAPVDGELLRFLYRRLQPGDTAAQIRSAMQRWWSFASLP